MFCDCKISDVCRHADSILKSLIILVFSGQKFNVEMQFFWCAASPQVTTRIFSAPLCTIDMYYHELTFNVLPITVFEYCVLL